MTMSAKRLMNTLTMSCLILILVSQGLSQNTEIRVDGQDIADLITTMSGDEHLGRKPLTPEFFKLHEWAADKFKTWGLEPAGDGGTYFQAVPITGRRGTYAFSTGTPQMIINGREFFAKLGDFSLDYRSTTNKKISGGIVFAGFGISSPDKGLDEYEGIEAQGKFVFVLKGSPNSARSARGSSSRASRGDDWAMEAKDSTKIMVAYDKGAAGIILYDSDTENRRSQRTPIYKSPFTRDFMVVSQISERVFQWLFWKDPQESSRGFDRRMNKIRLDIKNKENRSFTTENTIEITGFEKTTLYGEKFGNHHCRNVVAKILGTDPVLKNEYIVLGGHFDHLGVRNGQVYNGADDDASGSAVVMEVGRLMKKQGIQPRRTVIFCLWTGEELGLLGSKYWGDNPSDDVNMENVVINFNMDMVALGDKLGASGALNFPSIWEVIKRDQDEDVIDAVNPSEGGPGGSDHTPFIERGIESLMIGSRGGDGHPDYHDTGDDADKCDIEILRKTGQFVLQGTINAANESTSLIIPERQHIYDGMRWNLTTINPELRGLGRWRVVRDDTKSELTERITDRIQRLKRWAQDPPEGGSRRIQRSRLNLGLKGAHVFNHDIDHMRIAYTVIGFGRIDIHGDDNLWFRNGLTEDGRKGFAAMEDSSIVLHLLNPSMETFNDVLKSAQKSFLVTGISEFDSEQIILIKKKNVLISVDFDPQHTQECVARLELWKREFGDHENLLLNVVSAENIKDAKKALYRQLIKKGWTKEEIYAIGGFGQGGNRIGNLRHLGH